VRAQIKKQLVVHCLRQPYDIFVGRPSFWGNPFATQWGPGVRVKVTSHLEAIARHREWIRAQPEVLARIPELKGLVLGCFCFPLPCHGQTLVELANPSDQ